MQPRQTARQAGYNHPPFWEPGRRTRPAVPWTLGAQPRRGRRFTPTYTPYYHPTHPYYAQYQYMHNPYYQYDPNNSNYQFYGPNYQLNDANFQSFYPNYQLFGMYNQAEKHTAQGIGTVNASQKEQQQETIVPVQVAPPAAHCFQVAETISLNPQPPVAHQASHIPTNKKFVNNNARLTSDPPPAHQQAAAQGDPKPPDPDPRPLAPYRPQSQQLAILPKPQDSNSKNFGLLVQQEANRPTTSSALRRRNEKKAAEAKTRHKMLSQWPLAPQTVYQAHDGVVGGTQVMYQRDTQTLEAAQIVYQPSTDTYATAQIIYQPRTKTLAASHLLYQPQTDKIATAEAVYRPQADDEVMMTTRQTNYEPQANEITTTEAVYQPKADCITSRRVCIQTQTDEVTTTEAIYKPEANILAAREMNFQPQKNEIRATEGVSRPDNDIQARRQTKVCLQNNEVKTTEAIYRPRANILNTRVINFQPETNVITTTETVSHPRVEAESSFFYTSSSKKNWEYSKTEIHTSGRCRKDSTNLNRPTQKDMQGSNATKDDMSAPSLLRQILYVERNQEELQTSSMSRQNMKILEQFQQKFNTQKIHRTPDEVTPPKKTLRETRKRKSNTTQAVIQTAKSSSEETVVLTASEWLARLDSLSSSKSTSLQRQDGQQQSKSRFPNSSSLQKQPGYYATASPSMLHKEPVSKKMSKETCLSPKTPKLDINTSETAHQKTEEPTPSSIPMSWYQLWNWEARCQVISHTTVFKNYMHYKNFINKNLHFNDNL